MKKNLFPKGSYWIYFNSRPMEKDQTFARNYHIGFILIPGLCKKTKLARNNLIGFILIPGLWRKTKTVVMPADYN